MAIVRPLCLSEVKKSLLRFFMEVTRGSTAKFVNMMAMQDAE